MIRAPGGVAGSVVLAAVTLMLLGHAQSTVCSEWKQ